VKDFPSRGIETRIDCSGVEEIRNLVFQLWVKFNSLLIALSRGRSAEIDSIDPNVVAANDSAKQVLVKRVVKDMNFS